MSTIRIIPNLRDSSFRTSVHTIADALDKLLNDGEISRDTKLELVARGWAGGPPLNAGLRFRSMKGDEAVLPLPISAGCWVASTLGDRFPLALDQLDGGEVDWEGNVTLRDRRHVHAVTFDVSPVHFKLPELEENIVYLTIRFLGAERLCIRSEFGFVGIDYATLSQLRVPNVKALTRYVNARLGEIPRKDGLPPFKKVAIATVQRTLDLAGIQKLRGRRPRRRKAN